MNISEMARQARESSLLLATLPASVRQQALEQVAHALLQSADIIAQANALDLQHAQEEVAAGRMKAALYERLKLSPEKLATVAQGVRSLVSLPDLVGTILDETELDEGLVLQKVSCPIGVIGVIFESRPDVIIQICALCIKSGNAALLKGGKESLHTNRALMQVIRQALETVPQYPKQSFFLLTSRQEADEMLQQEAYIDLIIPRGSNALLAYVKQHTRIAVLGHADGVCHLYVARSATVDMACRVAIDAKTQYPAACNALETLLLDVHWPKSFAKQLLQSLIKQGVTLYGDASLSELAPIEGPVENWHTEYGEKKLSVKYVQDVYEAITHINTYGSHHTDSIVTTDVAEAELFLLNVDSAGVYHNASTRFADGQRYGFGAEVGISTGKTHARGPVGLEGLTIYKYKLRGQGHCVADYIGPQARAFTHQKRKGGR